MTVITQNKAVQKLRNQIPQQIKALMATLEDGSLICVRQTDTTNYIIDNKNRVFTSRLGENPNMLKSLNVLLWTQGMNTKVFYETRHIHIVYSSHLQLQKKMVA